MAKLIKQGQSFAAAGEYGGVLEDGLIATRPVHRTQHEFYLGFAMGYCREQGRGGQLQAIQVFWPDQKGIFPFRGGCDDETWGLQPRLDQTLGPIEIAERRTR